MSKNPIPQKPFLPHNGCANTTLSEMPLTHDRGGAAGIMSLSRVLQNRLKESAGSCTLGCLSLIWGGGLGGLFGGGDFWHIAFSQMPPGMSHGEHRCASRAYHNKVPDLRTVINLFPTVANQVQDCNGKRRKLSGNSQFSSVTWKCTRMPFSAWKSGRF